MSSSLPSNWNNCATCQFWTGPRTPTTFRDRVEFESNDIQGMCAGGGWDRSMKAAGSCCSDWVKWGVLE